jgi:hypothetical protein
MPDREGDSARKLWDQSFTFHRMLLLTLMLLAFLAQWLPADTLSGSRRSVLRQMWPQTWSFYTDVAGGSRLAAYHRPGRPGDPPEPLVVRQTGWGNLGGLRRAAHAHIAELASVSMKVPSGTWRDCPGGRLTACLPPAVEPTVTVANAAPQPTLCGSVLLTVERWRPDLTSGTGQTERVALIDVTCAHR